jgi:tyrosyl-tRNA synthetase
MRAWNVYNNPVISRQERKRDRHLAVLRNVEKQMELITAGAVEVIPAEEMAKMVERSVESGKPLVVKLGVDPTMPDLHIGHSVPLNKLRQFQQLGHQIVLIIGDFTALIGDPSLQDSTRPVLTSEEVENNARTYVEQASHIIDTTRARIVRNSQWLARLKFEDVLELTGRFTVARLLERDDFSRRHREGKPLGLHEFLYPVMQAYDSYMLDSDVEIGGTDQKFNLLAGRNLQRSMGQGPQCIVTLPLLEGTDGVKKMSKSLGNDIGITDEPADMFGKVMSIPDGIMWDYYRLVTAIDPSELERLRESVDGGDLNPKEAKERLAGELVRTYHGERAARVAADEFERVFRQKELPRRTKVVRLPPEVFTEGRIWVVELLVSVDLAPSRAEARRLIESGGISIEGRRIDDVALELKREEISGKILRRGRKNFVRVELGEL